MLTPNATSSGRIAALRLVEKDRELDRAPSRAAPFLRPVRGAPAFGGENARPAHIVVLGEAFGRRPSSRGSRPAGCRARRREPRRETQARPRSVEGPWVASHMVSAPEAGLARACALPPNVGPYPGAVNTFDVRVEPARLDDRAKGHKLTVIVRLGGLARRSRIERRPDRSSRSRKTLLLLSRSYFRGILNRDGRRIVLATVRRSGVEVISQCALS